jgi:hypothetical protein
MLTFEQEKVGGVSAIVEKLQVSITSLLPISSSLSSQNLPFQQVAHRADTIDSQPANVSDGSILVLVTGALQV